MRKKLLQYIVVRISPTQKVEIEREPMKEELQKILQALPKGKAPKLHGMTSKVLLASWSFLLDDCLKMIWHF